LKLHNGLSYSIYKSKQARMTVKLVIKWRMA